MSLTAVPSMLLAAAVPPHAPAADEVAMFGFLSGFFALAFCLYQRESLAMLRGFAVCLAAAALYGFMQGAWPLGILVTIWAVDTFRKSFQVEKSPAPRIHRPRPVLLASSRLPESESRISRMFGPLN